MERKLNCHGLKTGTTGHKSDIPDKSDLYRRKLVAINIYILTSFQNERLQLRTNLLIVKLDLNSILGSPSLAEII